MSNRITLMLENDQFWEWMIPEQPNCGINSYLEKIAANITDSGYLVDLLNEDIIPSPIMENLRNCIPREYFLEIQSCAKTYATLFSMVFPPLALHVDQLAYIEWLLYTETDNLYYRDHLVHMFKVAFVGDRLLSEPSILEYIIDLQFQSDHFQQWYENRKINIPEWGEEDRRLIVKIAFFLAALYHDIGYGYYFMHRYKQRLFKVNKWLSPDADITDINTDNTKILIQSLPGFFIKKYHNWNCPETSNTPPHIVAGFFHDCLPLNHSVASSLFVLDIAEKLFNYKIINDKLYVAFQLAAESCLLHDMTKKNRWAHLKTKENKHFLNCSDHKNVPIAMLLILADELSLWKRPKLVREFNENGYVISRLDDSNSPSKIKIIIENTKNKKIIIVANVSITKIKETFEKELSCLKIGKGERANKIPKLFDYQIKFKRTTVR